MQNNDNLSDLIDEASVEVDYNNLQSMQSKTKRRGRRRYTSLLPLALFTIAYLVYSDQLEEIPEPEIIAAELSDILRQARESVESATVDGQPPQILPNAALRAIVSYNRFPEGYFLSVLSQGVLAEMDHTGQITIEGVE